MRLPGIMKTSSAAGGAAVHKVMPHETEEGVHADLCASRTLLRP